MITRNAVSRWMMIGCICIAGRAVGQAAGQADLLIANARIFTAAGPTIERGHVIVRDQKIDAVGPGEAAVPAERVIDATGKTVVPGLIDVHRHFLPYSQATNEEELQRYIGNDLVEILEGLVARGITTVLSPGDPIREMSDVARRVERGDLIGPRLLLAGPVFTAPNDHPAVGPVCGGDLFCRRKVAVEVDDPATARQRVRGISEQGADFIKVAIDRQIVPDVTIEDAVFEAIAAEARASNLSLIVHVATVDDALRAVEMGADKLVHMPSEGPIEASAALLLKQSSVPVASTVSWTSPQVSAVLGREGESIALRHRQTLENVRYALDQGVLVAFGTDNPPPLGLTEFLIEAEELGTVLSSRTVLETMTINAAAYLDMEDRIGSIEVGKIADLVVVDGNPTDDLSALAKVSAVVFGGTVVVDEEK